jgi:aspartate/methionine/tyrosine aminotransferase
VDINPLAIELNEILREKAPLLYDALSGLGKELFFPRGILTQTAEAKESAHLYNATIGIATKKGEPIHLPAIMEHIKGLEPAEIFPYAPATGLPELRKAWREHQLDVNPGLAGKSISMPVVTSGLTHGLSICADLFCDAGDVLLLPDKLWGNYRMIFGTRRGADIGYYPFFDEEGHYNINALREALSSCRNRPKVLVLLNFPNNPTGYTPSGSEARAIADILIEAAEDGLNIVVIIDDAYYGLIYEDDAFPESLFTLVADAHPALTAIKLDGPTKEHYVWGLRTGFISFSCKGGEGRGEVYAALEKKTGGLIRGTISNCSMLAQSLLLKAMSSSFLRDELMQNFHIMKERYLEVKRVVRQERFRPAFRAYPFNSGYFMCVAVDGLNAEELRQHLLRRYGVGVIATDETDIRIAFSCIEKEQVEDLFDILYSAIEDLR